MTPKKTTEGVLSELIRNDVKTPANKKMEYMSLADSFMTDFSKNIMLTSIELDDKYPFGMDVWQEFLSYPIVKKYTEQFRKEIVRKNVEKGMAIGDKDALQIKRELDKEAGATGYENFVVFMLPPKSNEYDLS
jgi:hypothetical protein